MMGITHAGFAGFAWTTTANMIGFSPMTVAVGTLVAVGAGVAPDLDEPQSSAARSFGVAGRAGLSAARKAGGYQHRGPQSHSFFAALVVGVVVSVAVAAGNTKVLIGVVSLFALLGFGVLGGRKHRSRGVVFGVAAAVAAGWAVAQTLVFGWWLPISVVVGWCAHVVGDMVVGSSGVPAFWPLYRPKVAFGVMKVGGVAEMSVVMPGVFVLWGLSAVSAFTDVRLLELAWAVQG